MYDIPGYRLYYAVVSRFCPVRASGDGLSFQCLFPSRHKNGDRNWSGRLWIGRDGNLMARCMGCGATWLELAAEAGTDPRDWSPTTQKRNRMAVSHPPPGKPVIYQYRDRDGRAVYQKLRYEPGFESRPKSFLQRRPTPERWRKVLIQRDGMPPDAESWCWSLMAGQYGRKSDNNWDFRFPVCDDTQHTITLEAEQPLLYRLPELIRANPSSPVFICEGEKDAECLRSLGFVATCGHAGASTWLMEWAAEFRDRRVVVVPDHNLVGYQHADQVAGSCLREGAASVRVIRWDDDPDTFNHAQEGWGIGNWLLAHPETEATHKQFVIDLCKSFAEYSSHVVARPETAGAA